MTNIADFAKEIMKATLWLGCAILFIVMMIMVIIGVITHDYNTETPAPQADQELTIHDPSGNDPRAYIVDTDGTKWYINE